MIIDTLKQRRSHFRKEFNGKKVNSDVIDYLIECAHQAPSHKLTYPWRFKVFSGNSLKDWSQKVIEIYKTNTPIELQNEMQIQKMKDIPSEVSHVIALCMKRDEAARVPEIEEVCAVACAIQNIYLGLLDFPNVGGFWSTGNGTFSPQMHEYLNLAVNDKCLGFFMIGSVSIKRTMASRPDVSEFVEWI
jgi:nitroreductase